MTDFQQPPRPDFYQRKYIGDDYEPQWVKDYWDGEKWRYTKGGRVAKTQVREWREILTKGE